jgi:hypothetical protein
MPSPCWLARFAKFLQQASGDTLFLGRTEALPARPLTWKRRGRKRNKGMTALFKRKSERA